MNNDLKLIDIADDLVILNRNTIEKIFKLDNCSDCISLYLLYYKLAKWQKTDKVKANDSYVQKCLKWGKTKILNTKKILKENGLIEIIQNRSNGKIDGWYVKIHYIVSENKYCSISVEQEVLKQEVSKATCGFQDTIALRDNNNCLKKENNNTSYKVPQEIADLKKEIELLKEENRRLKENKFNNKLTEHQTILLEKFWKAYPRKIAKGNVEKWFIKNNPSEELVDEMIKKIELLKDTKQWKEDDGKYIPHPTTWLNSKGWEDDIKIDVKKNDWLANKVFFN